MKATQLEQMSTEYLKIQEDIAVTDETLKKKKEVKLSLGLKKIKVCLPFWPENWEGRYIKKKKKKQHKFFKILGRSEKGKQTSFLFRPYLQRIDWSWDGPIWKKRAILLTSVLACFYLHSLPGWYQVILSKASVEIDVLCYYPVNNRERLPGKLTYKK